MKSVMIVDDAAVMRLRLRDIISSHYNVVAEAENGVEALELYNKFKPDIITLDISMAEMNGIATLDTLMKLSPRPVVIMVSAMATKSNVYQAIADGAVDFIAKPFEASHVLRSMAEASANITD